jgi:hypothetical protein
VTRVRRIVALPSLIDVVSASTETMRPEIARLPPDRDLRPLQGAEQRCR